MKAFVRKLPAWLVLLGWAYFTYLFAWFGAYLLSGDHWWSVALINAMAPHLFWPLPLMALLGAVTRRRSLWVCSGLGVVVWVGLFGGLFNLPAPTVQASSPTFRAMTYNVEFQNMDVDAVAQVIRNADADVVGIQELTPDFASVLGPELEKDYPYQALDPQPSVRGMGIVSRYPIESLDIDESFQSPWIGRPQAVLVTLPGGPVKVLNVHFTHGRTREANARQVAAWAAAQTEPVVVVGDLNATDLSDAYGMLIENGLRDAWREVGWGYGHTFPATSVTGHPAGVPVAIPARLVRIDYAFCTPELTALDVERLPWDGSSDHRAVVAEFGRSGG